jgi:1,4-dihydroxy-2-naphthoate octaprenyltransferase
MWSAFLIDRFPERAQAKTIAFAPDLGGTNVSVKLNQFNGLRQILCLVNAKFVNCFL